MIVTGAGKVCLLVRFRSLLRQLLLQRSRTERNAD